MSSQPSSVMMWALTDEVLEKSRVLESQFHEIREKGFGGVAALVRCGAYAWTDEAAIRAFLRIGTMCAESGMECWLGMDPRGMRPSVDPGWKGVDVILFGDAPRATRVPNSATIYHRSFAVTCAFPPRETHVLPSGKVDYTLRDLYAVFAVGGTSQSSLAITAEDITTSTRLYRFIGDRETTARGILTKQTPVNTRACPFFRFSSTVFDFSDTRSVDACIAAMERLAKAGVRPDGVLWDEPGYICMHGSLPVSPVLEGEYVRRTGRPLREDIWKLAFESVDASHVLARNAYFTAVQESVISAGTRCAAAARRLWGRRVLIGIHDTWRWESADASDMNHGSLDLWRAGSCKSAGFADLGSVQLLHDPQSSFYSNLAASTIAARSMGTLHPGGRAYHNLWLTDAARNSTWTIDVMDHCVTVLEAFGLRWIAHIYGPAGTPGDKDSFLGLPYTPGYPQHPTWNRMEGWNSRLRKATAVAQRWKPTANLLVVFPVEGLYASPPDAADRAMQDIFRLLLALTDKHYQVDLVSSPLVAGGRWKRGRFMLGERGYDLLVLPSATVIAPELLPLLRNQSAHRIGRGELRLVDGTRTDVREAAVHRYNRNLLAWLGPRPQYRLVEGPRRSWVTLSASGADQLASVIPARCGWRYSGALRCGNRTIELPESGGLTRVLFPRGAPPRILKG